MKNYKIYKKQIILWIFLAIGILLFYHCPIKAIIGISCPGCGMTRALISAFCFDFSNAFNYHPLFPLIIIELIYLFFRKSFKVNQKAELIVGIITLFLFLIVWIFREFIL